MRGARKSIPAIKVSAKVRHSVSSEPQGNTWSKQNAGRSLGRAAQQDHRQRVGKRDRGYDDGLQHSGVLQNEDNMQLRLMTPQGIVETVTKSTIEERKTGLSAMPADLVNHMTKRQL